MGTIRFVLAISILCVHSSPFYKNYLYVGEVALETFFIMSGFYMALVLQERYSRTQDFYLARLLRIYPTYLIIFLLTVLGSVAYGSGAIAQDLKWPIAAYDTWREHWGELSVTTIVTLALTNILLVGQDIVMFLKIEGGSLSWTGDFSGQELPAWKFLFLPPAWSVSLELVFYALAPFLVRRRLGVLIGLLLGTLALRGFIAYGLKYTNDPWTYRFLPSEFPLFVAGILGYRFYAKYRDALCASRLVRKVGVIALCVWIGMSVFFNQIKFPYQGAAFLIYGALATPLVFPLTMKSRFDQFLGDLSYPLYLAHYPIILVAIHVWGNEGLFVAPLTIAFSIAYHLLIGRRIDRFRHHVAKAN